MSYDLYDSYKSRTTFGVVVLVAVVVVSGVAVFFGARFLSSEGNEAKDHGRPEEPAEVARVLDKAPEQFGSVEVTVDPESADQILNSLGIGVTTIDPALLVEQIGRALEVGKIQVAANLIGRKALSQNQLKQLQELAGQDRLKLDEDRPISEIGELEVNRRVRWALNLRDDDGSRIYLDLLRKQGKWGVEKVVLPGRGPNDEGPGRAVIVDALGITDAFLQAALRQKFETARSFVDPNEVSDAKIAGLCIVFEEGQYQLREHKPLRAVLNRESVAAFLANVETNDGSQVAQFGITLRRADENSPWRVIEINLDQLLADYAQRVAGGDVYYTPLIRNPKGGDTLILYFGFDEETLTARTERQLEIVSLLLQTDKKKKLTLSGHTDAIGSEIYNKSLSGRRAETVRQFLVDSGVPPGQIETIALGKTRPRRPNTTVAGADNPDGRRVNRRAEIYLDF